MTVQIYNTSTRQKEEFTPLVPGRVRMYVCGMTVYDYCHLGHARVMVVFDMVTRYLRARGYEVTYVRNITDVDDKIIKRALENNEDIGALTERFVKAMHEDAEALGVLPPDEEPRATRHMPEIIVMIGALLDKGFAYQAENGDVYYRVRNFPGYGSQLSGESLDDLQAGARVEAGEAKNDPLDFALWKAAKPEEPAWDSPWGRGRPGWHIECSAMSTHCLGNHFDIHGGGQDLRFPHHENEIAQSEAATGEKFVNLWMHNGFVRVNEEKMSKSLGNFFTVREILASYNPEVVRYFILGSHYRSPLNYSDVSLEHAKSALSAFYITLKDLAPATEVETGEYGERFFAAMDDDFNTPEAFAVLADLRHVINKAKEGEPAEARRLAGILISLGGILGLFQSDPETFLRSTARADEAGGLSDERIEQLIAQRNAARQARDWATADRIRDELSGQGVVLEDTAGQTSWRRQ
jgi:cysteinyl-tRNA synthetase